MRQAGTTIVRAESPKYGNDSFEVLVTPDTVIYPQIGAKVSLMDLSKMVSNTWTVVILPYPDSE